MVIDSLVLVVLLISALIAFFRGLIREVLTIGAALGGSAAAYALGPSLKPLMRGWLGVSDTVQAVATNVTTGAEAKPPEKLYGILPYDIVADGMSYGAIFVTVLIALSIVSHFIAEGVRHLGLGAVDRTLGFIFGLARGVLLLGILYLPVHYVDQDTKDKWFTDSKTSLYLEQVSSGILALIPSSAIENMGKNLENAKQVSDTAEKIQELNTLQQGTTPPQVPDTQKEGAEAGKTGYSDDFRRKMDELFKNQAQTPKTKNEKAP